MGKTARIAPSQEYIIAIRRYLRITSDALDSEITDLINAAKEDLALGGVLNERINDETDALIKRAVATYVKAEFGLDNDDSEKFRASYDSLKVQLLLANTYILQEEA